MTQDEMIAQANAQGFPNAKVVCDRHRPTRYGRGEFEECQKPECQALMAERRAGLRFAHAPTDEDKAAWREGLIGRAKPK